MRFAASPLLVAVALGLLGPAALDAEDEDCECADTLDVEAPLMAVVHDLGTQGSEDPSA